MVENNKKEDCKLNKVKTFFKETYNKRIIYMYIVIAILITLFIEILAKGSVLKGIYFLIAYPYVFICNAVIVLMTLSISLLMKRRVFGISFISLIWIIFGISNCILLANRVTPFTAVDLVLIDSAIAVMNKYFSVWQIVLVGVAIVLAIIGIVVIFIKAPKVDHKIKYIRTIIGIAIIWALGFGTIQLGIGSGVIPTNFGNLRDCYRDYGFVYCFSNSVVNTGIKRPDNYSEEAIQELVTGKKTKKKVKKVNVIFLQLESFFDLKKMTNIKLSQDPIPTFTKLKSKYPSGYFNVPIVGAGTVNTEFEVMTGMNLDDFGPGEYPFKTILNKTTCESICYNMKKYGYKCHAIHNNTATFYGRNIVFSNLGYDTFTSIENMDETEKTDMDWAKDNCLTSYIMDALKSTTQKDLIYTISVQGHGSYPDNEGNGATIKVDGLDDESMKHQYEYYATMTNEMDTFVKQLTNKLKKFKEKTILVMYGDHLPSLGITSDNLVNKNVYQTEYIIWSNFKTKYDNEDIEAYQLEAKILEKLNMTEGDVNNYSQLHRKDKNQEKYLEGLNQLSYDQLYGKNIAKKGKNPYKATTLQYGLHKVEINSVNPMNNDVGTVYVYGKYFTPYSKVYVNDEKYDTFYIDRSTIIIQDLDLKDGDHIKVSQQNSDTHILNETKDYIYDSEENSHNKIASDSKKTKDKKSKTNKDKKKAKKKNK